MVGSSVIRQRLQEMAQQLLNGNQILQRSAKLLMFNVEGSLGLAQIQVGKFSKNIARFCVKNALEEVISVFQTQAEAKGIEIDLRLLDFPLCNDVEGNWRDYSISTDEKRLQQVMINLLSNAVKFIRDQGKIEVIASLLQGIPN